MASDPQLDDSPDGRTGASGLVERRRQVRLPEELTAVITDSAVASALFNRLSAAQRLREANWVASAADRRGRARRAVEVVRHALRHGAG